MHFCPIDTTNICLSTIYAFNVVFKVNFSAFLAEIPCKEVFPTLHNIKISLQKI